MFLPEKIKKKAKQNSCKSNNNANINPFDLFGNMKKKMKHINVLYLMKKLPKKSTPKMFHLTINPKIENEKVNIPEETILNLTKSIKYYKPIKLNHIAINETDHDNSGSQLNINASQLELDEVCDSTFKSNNVNYAKNTLYIFLIR